MPDQKTPTARDAKLVQWLSEAYAKEAELEADLKAHIALTEKMSYKKRLRKHLTETRDHKRRVAARIKKLGGSASGGLPGLPTPVGEVAGKAVATVKGQLGAARAAISPQAETHLRNAQEELREEHVEIALYTRIETFAAEVGDRETAQLAKSIKRDEERMVKFLDAELVRLVKEVVRAEIPRDQRATSSRRTRRRTTAGSRTTPARSRAASRTATGVVRSTSRSTGSRSSGSRSTSSRSSGTTRSRNGGSPQRATSRARTASRA